MLITGGTGMIGSRLTEMLLAAGYRVIILSRNADLKSVQENLRYASWSPAKHQMDHTILSEVDYIVNLAGANIGAQRWATARKRQILESRTDSLETLVEALQNQPNHSVKALVSASAIGWYGPDRDPVTAFSEPDPPANDFLGEVCQALEGAVENAELPGLRKVILRTGLVLAPNDGALQEMKKPFNFNPALVLGSGKQVQSWIHLEDICRAYQFSLEEADMQGVFNAVTPSPLPYRRLVEKIANFRHKKHMTLRIPAALLRLGLGEMADLLLNSSTVSSVKLTARGFSFRYPELNTETLRSLSKK